MKKILFLLIAVLSIIGCSKEETAPEELKPGYNGIYNADSIFKQTGCKVKKVETIKQLTFFTDSRQNKYLYGARSAGERNVSWISRYKANGDLLWETIEAARQDDDSKAWNLTELSNGDLALIYIIEDSKAGFINTVKETYPVIVSSQNGKMTPIITKEKHHLSYIEPYNNFFICGITEHDLMANPYVTEWHAQISNAGEIMFQAKKINKPNKNSIWLSNNEFIRADDKVIERTTLDQSIPATWKYPTPIETFKSYTVDMTLNNNLVTVVYHIQQEGGTSNEVEHTFSVETGEKIKYIESIKIEPKAVSVAKTKEVKVTAVITPTDAVSKELEWTSSDPNIATVNNDGTIKGINKGQCKIIASTKDKKVSAECDVTVTQSAITLESSQINLLLNDKATINYQAYPEDLSIQWESSDPSIATVNNGEVSGLKIGTATITAKSPDGEAQASCTVKVEEITAFVKALAQESSIIDIGGYISGTVNSAILNQSNVDITLTRFEVIDSKTGIIVDYIENDAQLGVLKSHERKNIKYSFKNLYRPIFKWYFMYKNKIYNVEHG